MHGGHHGGHAPASDPYAGFERRPIKALSDQQIADLRAGRGMGLALPAELNGYPGPLHVLDMADALALTEDQRRRTRALFEAMKSETIALGERIIGEEAALDRLFAERRITPDALSAATARIGNLQGELRAAHLRYHLAMHGLLSPDQVARYDRQRGYARP
jgi:Spy/CpxP family protein refolding chaperone